MEEERRKRLIQKGIIVVAAIIVGCVFIFTVGTVIGSNRERVRVQTEVAEKEAAAQKEADEQKKKRQEAAALAAKQDALKEKEAERKKAAEANTEYLGASDTEDDSKSSAAKSAGSDTKAEDTSKKQTGAPSSSNAKNEALNSDAVTKSVDLSNLAVGETADFSNYSITVNSIEQAGGYLTANVTMNARQDSTFANRYLTAIGPLGEELYEESTDESDVKVPAGTSHTATIKFKDNGFGKLMWDNWSNEAKWVFTPEPTALAQGEEQKKLEEEKDDLIYAWQDVEEYGKDQYPYGFNLHYILGVLNEEKVGENEWFLKATCDVTNMYDATMEDLNCEAYVTGSGTDWTVTSFTVY